MIFASIHVFAQNDAPQETAASAVEIVLHGDEPELRVDGVPFFVNAAQFDYFRIPPDLWIRSLTRYRELGINTIDLRIPWNWHEPTDGQFDFDGHTNPRRNLRGLLRQIAQMHLKLIVHPGPVIGDGWRNAGYPPWLLVYSDFKMSAVDIQRGIAPPDAQLAARDGNAAAHAWFANEIHMTYARRWLTAVAQELAPYSAKNMISIPQLGSHGGEVTDKQISGPLLFVALDDALAFRAGSEAPDLARYVSELRGALRLGGLDEISFISARDAFDQGVTPAVHLAAAADPWRLGFTGEWFYRPLPAAATPVAVRGTLASAGPTLSTTDASSLIFLTRSLGTQTNFPPFLSAFATTSVAPGNDTRAAQSAPENMLLASRLFVGNGLRAMEYSPLQDTLTPAGWETPSAPRYFRSDAPLDLAGNKGARATGVSRNGEFISVWGAMLASSHLRADFGVVDLRASAGPTDQAAASKRVQEMEKLFRVAALGGYSPELVNPGVQSVERLLRNRAIVLLLPEDEKDNFALSVEAQTALVEFVKRGGALIYFAKRPQGELLEPLFRSALANSPQAGSFNSWTFERGRVISTASNLYSWVSLDGELSQNRAQPESFTSIESLAAILEDAGVYRTLTRHEHGEPNTNLLTSQIVPNRSAAASDETQTCAEKQFCAAALISMTNLSPDQAAEESFELTNPRPSVGKPSSSKISFNVSIPARESLFLPVHAPLCSAALSGEHCSDEVVVAGAELLAAEREGKTLELSFYAPARAIVRLHLESEPSKVELEEDIRLDTEWNQETGELGVRLLRGAAPDYRRVLRVHLRYTPHVPERIDPAQMGSHPSDYEVFDGIRFPLGPDVTIPSGPPLIAADPNSGGHMVIVSLNHSEDVRQADFNLDGPFHGSTSARMFGEEELFTRFRFQPYRSQATSDDSAAPGSDGLLRGSLTIRSGHDHGTTPLLYVTANEAGYSHYQYDFDRDGSPEWTLESSRLRLIVSPADSGRALALVDKSTSDSIITLGGALHDFLIAGDAALPEAGLTGDFAFNRPYHAEWIEGKQDTSLRLTFQDYENSPAGLHVEKTLHFAAPETVEVNYRVFIVTPPSGGSPSAAKPNQSFVSMLSIPLSEAEDRNSRVCWQTASASQSDVKQSAGKGVPDPHCEDIMSKGAPISIPDSIARVEISSQGRVPLMLEWTSGNATIVPEVFSAQVHLRVPVPKTSDAPSEFALRYTVEKGQ